MVGTMLWWGRFDPDYSRNRILRHLLGQNGISIVDFKPRSSFFGSLEALLRRPKPVDAIWVPCFRHRDLASARRFANRTGASLIFDPLISSWDKIVFERAKYPANHSKARQLLTWEQSLFKQADYVVADTNLHARFYIDQLCARPDRTYVIPVGAEESLFFPQPDHAPATQPEILFFGSFINLQGPQFIIDAARMVSDAHWTLLGDGPLRDHCRRLADGLDHVHFEDWLPYEQLARRIGAADIILGIFGDSPKAGRVIPNKVYQALACGRPVITRHSEAYPAPLREQPSSGMIFVDPADPTSLAAAAKNLLAQSNYLQILGRRASQTYASWFSESKVNKALVQLLLDLSS
jgi:glycosyltransferase involved in cell wall biosynthesis